MNIFNLVILSLLVTSAGAFSPSVAFAYDGKPLPKTSTDILPELKDVGIEQKIGSKLDLNAEFADQTGKRVKLADYLSRGKPLIVSLVYYNCPSLCNFHLSGFIEGLKSLDWSPGEQFEMIALSFDSKENPEDAAAKAPEYLKAYGRPGTEKGWHFLTGSEDSIQNFTKQVGFKYKWNDKDKEWAHASAAIVITPDGIVSRYLPGIVFESKDIRLALNEAAQGKLGTFVDKMVLFCFKYDHSQNKYALYAFNLMKLAALLTILLMALWLIPFWLKMKRQGQLKEIKKAL